MSSFMHFFVALFTISYYTYRQMNKIPAKERHARAVAERLMEQVRSLGFMLKASVVRRSFKCGSPGCRCRSGRLHRDIIVTRKVGKKTRTFRLRQGREAEAFEWQQNWRRLKRILCRMAECAERILSTPAVGAEKRPENNRIKRGHL